MDYTSLSDDSEYETTPFLQSLEPESTVFQNTISPSIWTLPVHASVFTGHYPPEHGVYTGEELLSDHPTFAELLSKHGYSTNAFYRNGWLNAGDILRGFNISKNNTSKNASTPSKTKQLADFIGSVSSKMGRRIERAYDIQKQYRSWKTVYTKNQSGSTDGRRTIEEAINSIDINATPFCWFIHLNDAHWRYDPPSPYHLAFTKRRSIKLAYNYGFWQWKIYGNPTNRLKTTVGKIAPPEQEIETFRNLYRGAIKYCDSLIRDIVSKLNQENIWDNTILIVFGDHGEAFGENGIFGHHFSLDESLIHVPLLIRDPSNKLDIKNVTTPTSLVDVYPTLLELVGITGPSTKGIDLTSERREYCYTFYDISELDYYCQSPQRGVEKERLPSPKQSAIWRSKDEKVIRFPNDDVTIGDNNRKLLSKLTKFTEQIDTTNANKGNISAEVIQQLKQMGYLDG